MYQVALCIATEHDPRLVLLAVAICTGGAFATVQMLERAIATRRLQRWCWASLTAVAAGATIWSTHFLAMLGYEPGVPVSLDGVLTIVSLLVAIVGTLVALAIVAAARTKWIAAAGGVVFGLAVSAMHYIGMSAFRVDGIVTWRPGYVTASVVLSVAFAAAAFAVLRSGMPKVRRRLTGTGLVVLGIAALHFVGMTALQIAPLHVSDTTMVPRDWTALAFATAVVGVLVIGAGAFAALIDRETRSDVMERLHHMAMTDALTGLPNRACFQTALAHEIAVVQASGGSLALIAIDLDRFKEVNDVHGHKAGDDVLVAMAARLRARLGDAGLLARLGGDEFNVLTRFSDREELTALVDRLDRALREPVTLPGFEARLGASIGVALFPQDAADADCLCNNADLSMYRAKCDGAGRPRYYDNKLDEAIRARRELANDLRQAIESGSLHLAFQVQENVATRAITGYEALVRWTHPVRGPIPPAEFVPIAEEHGLILPLGEWVLRRACADAAQWPDQAKVAVNISALQLAHTDLPQLIHEVLLESGLPPRRLEIELTESAIIIDKERALHVLRQIKALGVGVALDDFGTGYSSLETLRAFPFDKIKLDRLFVSEIVDSPQATAIIRAVLALGKSLSIPVLAEGIETHEQLDVLHREGCDEAQGYLLGYPGPIVADGTRLRKQGRSAA